MSKDLAFFLDLAFPLPIGSGPIEASKAAGLVSIVWQFPLPIGSGPIEALTRLTLRRPSP